jgi:hypothetical protein
MKIKGMKFLPVVAVALLFALLTAGTVSAVDLCELYYEKHPLDVAQLEKIWGKPVLVEKLDSGLERHFYEVTSAYPQEFRYRYFIIKDAMVIGTCLSDKKGETTSEFESGKTIDLSKSPSEAYYSKHSLSLEDVEKAWGKPAHVKGFEDGLETRVYEVANPYPSSMKYRYFLFKDKKVIASGITDVIGTQKEADTCPLTGPPVSHLSKLYYERNDLMVNELDRVWGKPLAVQKIANGMENRVYEIANPYPASMKYRYFLSKNGKVVGSGISQTPVCDIGVQ